MVRSSTKSEYIALVAVTVDIIWLRQIMADFGISLDNPIELYYDNMSAIALANIPFFHARIKHI